MDNSKQELSQALEDYREYVAEHFLEDSQEPATKREINEFAKQVFYALKALEKAISESH